MYDAKWQAPVVIDLSHPHGRQTITTVREAADCLMDIWPEPDHSVERDEALRICLEVFEGNASADDARDAFLAAARSAGLSTS
ncbi:DUF982 domain-containing protein [Rhizobium sp. ZPR3]|uniref:DUF982 domain-containing protein n=2 Tax=unclassified Rhizobium TaxID=2613769 RepID=A0AAU7SP35_9HYPH